MSVSEKWPSRRGWEKIPTPPTVRQASVVASMWQSGRISVVSALSMADAPNGSGKVIPQWHVSVSRFGKRPTDRDVERARDAFGFRGWEEDNHHPGGARHFWQPVDPGERVDCECKATEETITDPDGYRWTNPTNGEPCRGCELQGLTGKACPLHMSKPADA